MDNEVSPLRPLVDMRTFTAQEGQATGQQDEASSGFCVRPSVTLKATKQGKLKSVEIWDQGCIGKGSLRPGRNDELLGGPRRWGPRAP